MMQAVLDFPEVVWKLADGAARRRSMKPETLLMEIAAGVLVRGVIEKQREAWQDWKLSKRAREVNGRSGHTARKV